MTRAGIPRGFSPWVRRAILLLLNSICCCGTRFSIPTEHRNTMQVENKTSGKSSTKKKDKSRSLKLEAHRLKAVGS